MESTTSAKNQPCVETGKSKPSQIPRALSLIRKGANKFYSLYLCATYQQMCHPGMAFMQHRSSPKPNQGKQHSCNLVRSVCPKKWEQNQDSKQPSSPSFGKQDNKPSKSTKTPKAVKPVSNNKKLLCRPSPYSYSTKNPTQQSRIPVRRCQSVTLIVERIALLESEEMELEERLRIVRNQLENLKFLRTNQTFIDRMNQTSNQKMSKIEEEPSVSPSSAYLRPLRPRVFSVNDDIQSSH
uniref:Uncharacterized protein n=1 Tax=Daphnia magna TaxID=35525 RepID=A0A0P5XM48_9CRUS